MFLKVGEKKNKLLVVIMAAGFIAGLFFMNIGKKALLDNTGFLSEYTLYEMKYSVVDGNAFFAYLLRKRVGSVLALAVLSTTWLGLAAAFSAAAWLGISFGMLFMAALLRYGAKGCLLILVGVLPQAIFYLPAVVYLLCWSHELCTVMYFPHRAKKSGYAEAADKNSMLRKKGMELLCLLAVVIIGCLLESYVNPKLVLNLLRIF